MRAVLSMPSTQPHVCLQRPMLFAPVLPSIFEHLSALLIYMCLHIAANLVNSTLAGRDIRTAQGSNKLFELRRSYERRWGRRR